MANWKEVTTDMGSGAVAGVVDQVIKKSDIDRASTQGKPQLPWTKRFGTYYNYGIPILTVIGVGMNKLRGDWATRMSVIGGQLAGREVTESFQNRAAIAAGKSPVYYRPAQQIVYTQAPNQPIINQPAIPVVQPPGVFT